MKRIFKIKENGSCVLVTDRAERYRLFDVGRSSLRISLVIIMAGILSSFAAGIRPYELNWAGRDKDDHPALVDFEKLEGWTVECSDSMPA